MASTLASQERQEQLLKYIEDASSVNIAGVCARFQISEATARRDLEALAGQGRIRRVHGGARAIHHAPPELPVYQRMNEQAEAKQRIAQAAAGLVQDGETIFLGSGTTAFELARRLEEHKNLTVITNSLLVLNALAENENINLIGLGGMFRRSEQSLIGHIAEQSLLELRADKVMIGIHSLDPVLGLTNQYLPETVTDRKILQVGRETIILADHTKLGRTASAFVAPTSAIHTLVTDQGASAEVLYALRAAGVRVLCV
jgi:DeoR/GlpR family transcriptional regulator of sugar metabolism